MARAKRIYILIIKVNNLFSLFSSWCFLKEAENMYSLFLSSYTNTRERLGELEKAVESLACGSCSHSISRSSKLPLVFVKLDRNTVHVFSLKLAKNMRIFSLDRKNNILIKKSVGQTKLTSSKKRPLNRLHQENGTAGSALFPRNPC